MPPSSPSSSAGRPPESDASPWFLLVNPVSGNGKGGRLQARVERAMQAAGIFAGSAVSMAPGHLQQLAQEALASGHRKLAMLGGDGTANEVLNGVFTQRAVAATEVTLGMVGVGTGNDWLRTLGIAAKPEAAIEAMLVGRTGWHDVGLVHHGPDLKAVRYFLNIAGAGFDGEVTRKVNAWTGPGKGTKWSYWLCILQELFRYRHTHITLTVDGQSHSQVALTMAIGVCRYNGGGMMQLPEAQFDDGLLDASIIGSMSKAAMVRHLPDVMDGSFTRLEAVQTMRGKTFHLTSDEVIWVEADGEIIAPAPVEISLRSKAFRVLLPPLR